MYYTHGCAKGKENWKREDVPFKVIYSFFLPFFFVAKDIGTHIIAVGIGNQIDIKELEKIRGERGSAIQFSGFESLLAKLNEIVPEICGEFFREIFFKNILLIRSSNH